MREKLLGAQLEEVSRALRTDLWQLSEPLYVGAISFPQILL